MPMLKRADTNLLRSLRRGFPILLYAPWLKSEVNMWAARRPTIPTDSLDGSRRRWPTRTPSSHGPAQSGKSVADVKPDHGWHTFAADHLALIDHLGFKKFHVMGGCIGGSYCFEAIEQAPTASPLP